MCTKLSAGNLSMKHFPKEAACKRHPVLGLCRPQCDRKLGGRRLQPQPKVSLRLTHPQQRLLGVWLVLIAGCLYALAHRLWEQLLVLDLPQVFVCLLALLLQGSMAHGVSFRLFTCQGELWEPQHPWHQGPRESSPWHLGPGRDLRDVPLPITMRYHWQRFALEPPQPPWGRQDPEWGSGPYLVLLLCLQQKCPWGHGGDLEDLLAGLCRYGMGGGNM